MNIHILTAYSTDMMLLMIDKLTKKIKNKQHLTNRNDNTLGVHLWMANRLKIIP